ncbi:hypothetical protein AMTRI_Chr09g36760 [Amborella trichopoda]
MTDIRSTRDLYGIFSLSISVSGALSHSLNNGSSSLRQNSKSFSPSETDFACCWIAYSAQESKQGKALDEFQEGRKTLEEGLKGKFFSGENIGFVDIIVNFLSLWMGAIGEAANIEYYDAEKTPLIHSWIEEFISVEVVKESLPSHDMLIAFFKG